MSDGSRCIDKCRVKPGFKAEKCRGYCSEYHMESLTPVAQRAIDTVAKSITKGLCLMVSRQARTNPAAVSSLEFARPGVAESVEEVCAERRWSESTAAPWRC